MKNAIPFVCLAIMGILTANAKADDDASPSFFPDIINNDIPWFLSLPQTRPDGLQANTRLWLAPIGKIPLKRWRAKIECERANLKTRQYKVIKDRGTAVAKGDLLVIDFPQLGAVTMMLTEPMTVRAEHPFCANGVPWFGVDD